MRKRCFKCERVLPIDDFYVHGAMRDGRLGKCKDCAKGDVQKNYRKNQKRYASYERVRNQQEDRRAARAKYASRGRQNNRQKYLARSAVSNAIRDGRLDRRPCRVCGADAQAHHGDYSKPLEVDWLCFKHHREIGHGQQVTEAT